MMLSWRNRRAPRPSQVGGTRPARQARRTVPTLEALEGRTLLSFAPAVNHDVGTQPGSVAVADFRGNGKLDLAVANIYGNNVSILLGNGDGTFQNAVNYDVGTHPRGLAVGDFRGNGRLDLAVVDRTNFGENGQVSILLGNGDGTFHSAVTYAAGGTADAIALGDFHGDGHIDLAVANYSDDTVSILRGNGDGTFASAVTYAAGRGPTSIAVGDFNEDGKPDLAVADRTDNTVSVLLNDGTGRFPSRVAYSAGTGPSFVVAADFNADHHLDLAVANRGNGTDHGNVSVLLGNGNGTFRSAVNYTAGTYPWALAVGNFHGDGNTDLAVANKGSGTVSVLRGNGDGTFRSAVDYAADSQPFAVAVGDFNGDTAPDLVVANSNSNDVSVLLNRPEATHFRVSAPDEVTAGAPFDITVTALSAFNTTVTDYAGTVTFTNPGDGATVPDDYPFTAADRGTHPFPAGGVFIRAGGQTIAVADAATPTIAGSKGVTVDPEAADHLRLDGPPSVGSDEAFALTVTVLDRYNNTVTGYTGTVTFTSSDSAPLLPHDYTFTADDQGQHVFIGVMLHDVGDQTIRAADTLDPTLAGTLTVSVG
jgi:hypothetical protein